MTGKRIISILIAAVLLFTGCVQNPLLIYASEQEVDHMFFIQGIAGADPTRVESGKEFYFGDLVTVSLKQKNNGGVFH